MKLFIQITIIIFIINITFISKSKNLDINSKCISYSSLYKINNDSYKCKFDNTNSTLSCLKNNKPHEEIIYPNLKKRCMSGAFCQYFNV